MGMRLSPAMSGAGPHWAAGLGGRAAGGPGGVDRLDYPTGTGAA
jgi:hypothetical protein